MLRDGRNCPFFTVLNPLKANIVRRVEDWPWSCYPSMIGIVESADWLSCDYVLSQFSKQRKTAIKKYQAFVSGGLSNGPIWNRLNQQIYLGEADFVDKVQQHLKEQARDLQIPKVQKRPGQNCFWLQQAVTCNSTSTGVIPACL